MKHRSIVALAAASALALGIAGSIAAPAYAGPSDTWGYITTAVNSDGSLNFADPGSGWTLLGPEPAGATLGSLDFSRGGIDYTVTVNAPASVAPMLVANIVADNTNGVQWSYTYSWGSGSTSGPFFSDGIDRLPLYASGAPTYYVKSQAGNLAVAVTGVTMIGTSDTVLYSEVLDVTSDGALVHNLTFTNQSTATLSGAFSALVDTDLNGVDDVPIVSNGTNSVYITDSGTFYLYLTMLKGNQMTAGDWGYGYSSNPAMPTFVDVNGFTLGSTVFQGYDSAISYNLNSGNLAPGTSTSLAFEEQLFAPTEIGTVNVQYVDDDNGGAAITPPSTALTTLLGPVGTPVGFTEAHVVVPDGLILVSIDNVTTFASGTQTITVHLARPGTPGPPTVPAGGTLAESVAPGAPATAATFGLLGFGLLGLGLWSRRRSAN